MLCPSFPDSASESNFCGDGIICTVLTCLTASTEQSGIVMTCGCAHAELLSLVMRRLEEPPGLERSEECFRTVALLALLLQRFPGDMAPAFQADALAFFRDTLLPALLRLECALDPALHAPHVARLTLHSTTVELAKQWPTLK